MKYLWIILLPLTLYAGLTGDRPHVVVGDQPVAYPEEPTVTSSQDRSDEWKYYPLKRIRTLKCKGMSIFDVATKLILEGYHNPYTKEYCGVGITEGRDTIGTVPIGDAVRDKRGRWVYESNDLVTDKRGKRTKAKTKSRPADMYTITEYTADTSIVDTLFEKCWVAFIRYMGVKNWREWSSDGARPTMDQPGILHPVSQLEMVRNSRWEKIVCGGEKKAPARPRDRRIIGTGAIVSGGEDRGDPRKKEFEDYIEQRIAELRDEFGSNLVSHVRTTYNAETGLVENQGQYRQGMHESAGSVTLDSGEATIDLNTKVSPGRRDVTYLGLNTYGGWVQPLDTSSANTYQLVPISGRRFKIISSSSTDTATVNYRVMGD